MASSYYKSEIPYLLFCSNEYSCFLSYSRIIPETIISSNSWIQLCLLIMLKSFNYYVVKEKIKEIRELSYFPNFQFTSWFLFPKPNLRTIPYCLNYLTISSEYWLFWSGLFWNHTFGVYIYLPKRGKCMYHYKGLQWLLQKYILVCTKSCFCIVCFERMPANTPG